MLEEHGLVSRVHAFGDQARFDANLDPHYHLVCVRCRSVSDRQDGVLVPDHEPPVLEPRLQVPPFEGRPVRLAEDR